MCLPFENGTLIFAVHVAGKIIATRSRYIHMLRECDLFSVSGAPELPREAAGNAVQVWLICESLCSHKQEPARNEDVFLPSAGIYCMGAERKV